MLVVGASFGGSLVIDPLLSLSGEVQVVLDIFGGPASVNRGAVLLRRAVLCSHGHGMRDLRASQVRFLLIDSGLLAYQQAALDVYFGARTHLALGCALKIRVYLLLRLEPDPDRHVEYRDLDQHGVDEAAQC